MHDCQSAERLRDPIFRGRFNCGLLPVGRKRQLSAVERNVALCCSQKVPRALTERTSQEWDASGARASLGELLEPGGLLILQTPNAASLGKRVKLALGLNPFDGIRTDRLNPGHYREYTLRELIDILRRSGFLIDSVYQQYYFDMRFARHETGTETPRRITGAIRNVAYRLLPPSMRESVTIVTRKKDEAAASR
jgi:hypothetical protein